MRAYTQTINKSEFVAALKAHQAADNFRRGKYWDGSKGCAVGCGLESVARLKGLDIEYGDHTQYPIHLGIPQWLAYVEDRIFEGCSESRSRTWPVEFAEAIPESADLDTVKVPFLVLVLEYVLGTLDKLNASEDVVRSRVAVKQTIAALKSGNAEELRAAEAEAWAAAAAANGTARAVAAAAAWAAADAAAAWAAAEAATEAVADAVVWAARAADVAAAEAAALDARAAAAGVAAAARAAAEAMAAAKQETYDYFADRLLELIRGGGM